MFVLNYKTLCVNQVAKNWGFLSTSDKNPQFSVFFALWQIVMHSRCLGG